MATHAPTGLRSIDVQRDQFLFPGSGYRSRWTSRSTPQGNPAYLQWITDSTSEQEPEPTTFMTYEREVTNRLRQRR
jgi:hypothetical protein